MNENELRQLIQRDEGENLEFKQALLSRKQIGEYAVGIGNEGGGWLVLGITDARPRQIAGIRSLPRRSSSEFETPSSMRRAFASSHVRSRRPRVGFWRSRFRRGPGGRSSRLEREST